MINYRLTLKEKLIASTAAMKGLTSATFQFNAATMSMSQTLKMFTSAWLASPMGITTITIAGIYAIGKAIDYMSHESERLTDKMNESVQTYADLSAECESLETQLNETNNRLKEIDSQGTISVVDETEKQRLELLNKDLERQLQIKKDLADVAKLEAEQNAIKAYNSSKYTSFTFSENQTAPSKMVSGSDMVDQYIRKINELEKKRASLGTSNSDIRQAETISKTLNVYRKELIDLVVSLQATKDAMSGNTKEGIALASSINTALNIYDKFTQKVRESNSSEQTNPFVALDTSDLQKYVDETNTLISSMGSMYKEQYENGELSIDTLSKLMQENENWIELVSIENGVIKLNTDVVIENTKQKIQAKIDEIEANTQIAISTRDTVTAQLTQLKLAVEGYKAASKAALTYAEAAGAGNKVVELQQQISGLESDLSTINSGIDKNRLTVDALTSSLNRLDSNDPFGNLANSIKKANDEAQKLLEKQLRIEGEAYSKAIDNRISKLEEEKKAEAEYYDKKIQQLQDEKDAINQVADEEDRLFNLQKAKVNWENAQKQKTALIYRQGQGWVYDVDTEKVNQAKEEYDKLQKEYNKYLLNKEIDEKIKKYEDAKKAALAALDSEIDGWKKLKDKVSESMSNIGKSFDDYQLELELLAEAQKLNFAQMGNAAEDYAERVIAAMKRAQSAMGGASNSSGSSSNGSSNSSSGSSNSSGSDARRRALEKQISDLENKISKLEDRKDKSQSYAEVVGLSNQIAKYEQQIRTLQATLDRLPHYAKGTLSAGAGIANVDELGKELIVRNPLQGRLTTLEYGDSVIPAQLAKNIMAFGAFSPNQFASGILKNALPSISNNNNQPVSIQFTGDLSFPEIRDGSDAQEFINQIKHISIDARQMVGRQSFKTQFN